MSAGLGLSRVDRDLPGERVVLAPESDRVTLRGCRRQRAVSPSRRALASTKKGGDSDAREPCKSVDRVGRARRRLRSSATAKTSLLAGAIPRTGITSIRSPGDGLTLPAAQGSRLHAHRQPGVASHGGGMHHLGTVVVHLPRWEPPEHLPKSHLTFDTGERGADAEMGSVSE